MKLPDRHDVPMIAAAVTLAIVLVLIVATYVFAAPSPAAVSPPVCVPAGMVSANLSGSAESIDAVDGPEAQRVSDAIASLFGTRTIEVASFAAYIRGQAVKAFGFDAKGCVVVSGDMQLKVYQAARAAAFGLSL